MLSYLALASDASSSSGIMGTLQFWKTAGFSLFLSNLLSGIIILVIGFIILKIILATLNRVFSKAKNISALLREYLIKILSVLGWVILIITFLSQLGIDMAPMIAGLGITGVVLGLALKDSISNFFAGFMIILNEPFRKEDYVEIGSYSGTVKAMDLICVKLRTPDGKKVSLSNNLVWASPVTNYSDTDMRRVGLTVGVPYDTDLKVARQLFLDVIKSYPEVLEEPAPAVEIGELADSSINFVIRPWVKPADYWTVSFRFNGEITDRLAEKNIYLPFPQMDVHVQNEN